MEKIIKMMELKGTAEEIADAILAISPTWPVHIIKSMWTGEYHFILNGIDTKVTIIEKEK